ncbi:hypothetical protein [Streptomyces sp. NPDC060010]|uniref:hypothetical protein n=1 Tax=Streptomyces sp. NPDC060010 TaxID=3347036 RepID=UPI00368AD474
MEDTPMPEPLRRAVHQLVAEAVTNCQEVLSHTEPFAAYDWKRMTLYRATDAADTMNTAAMLIAAYCQDTDMAKDDLDGFLQLSQQRNRAWGARVFVRTSLGTSVRSSFGTNGWPERACGRVLRAPVASCFGSTSIGWFC